MIRVLCFLLGFIGIIVAQQYPPIGVNNILTRTNQNNFRRFDEIVVYLDFYFATVDDVPENEALVVQEFNAVGNRLSFIDLNIPESYRRFRSVFYPIVDEFTQLQVPAARFGESTIPYSLIGNTLGGMFDPTQGQEVIVTLSVGDIFTTAAGVDANGTVLENRTILCNPSFGNEFTFQNSLNETVNLNGTTGFQCDPNQGVRWWRYPFPDLEFFTSFFTVVINVDGGEIQSIVWDDSCSECGGTDLQNGECVGGFQCGLSVNGVDCISEPLFTGNGTQLEPGDVACGPRVFLTWVGTDANNDECTSFSSAPSQFELYSANPVFEAASQSTSASFV